MTIADQPDNDAVVLDRVAVILTRIEAAQAAGRAGDVVTSLLDADDLAALRHSAGILLAFTAVGEETEMDSEMEKRLRAALRTIYALMAQVARQLAQKEATHG